MDINGHLFIAELELGLEPGLVPDLQLGCEDCSPSRIDAGQKASSQFSLEHTALS
jgi:hypothetical protein